MFFISKSFVIWARFLNQCKDFKIFSEIKVTAKNTFCLPSNWLLCDESPYLKISYDWWIYFNCFCFLFVVVVVVVVVASVVVTPLDLKSSKKTLLWIANSTWCTKFDTLEVITFVVQTNIISLKMQFMFIQWVSRIWASLTWLWFQFRRLELITTTAPAAL